MNKEVIKKISDIITIVTPAIVAVLGVLQMNDVIPMAEKVSGVIMAILGSLATTASVTYNVVSKENK